MSAAGLVATGLGAAPRGAPDRGAPERGVPERGVPERGVSERAAVSMFVTITVRGQLCGIPVLSVRDIIVTPRMTRIPLAPPEIAGSMNLRGRIVTGIDLRRRLNLPPGAPGDASMSVVVERQGELYSLIVEQVREVIELDDRQMEPNPPTLGAAWREFSAGIYRLQPELLIVLNTERVLAIG